MERAAPVRRLLTLIAAALLNSWLCFAQTTVTLAIDHVTQTPNPAVGQVAGPATSGNGFSFALSSPNNGSTSVSIDLSPATLTGVTFSGNFLNLTPGTFANFHTTFRNNVPGLEISFYLSGVDPNGVANELGTGPSSATFTEDVETLNLQSVGGVTYATINVGIGNSTAGFAVFTAFYTCQGCAAPPPPPSVMEAIQVTQSLPTDTLYYNLPLIAGKSTAVRLYPVLANATVPVTATLTVMRGGQTLGPPLTPINGTVKPTPAVDRSGSGTGFWDRTALEFIIPGSMTKLGDLTLNATFMPPEGVPASTPLPTAPPPRTLQFVPQAKQFTVTYEPVCFGFPVDVCPSKAISDQAEARFLSRILPVADDGVDYVRVLIPPLSWIDEVADSVGRARFKAYLRKVYIIMNVFGVAGDQLVAWFAKGVTTEPGATEATVGSSDPLWDANLSGEGVLRSAVGHVLMALDTSPPTPLPYPSPEDAIVVDTEGTLAHEIGHNLGLRHPKTMDNGGANGDGSCYPYSTSVIPNPGFDPVDQLFVPQAIPGPLSTSGVFDVMSYHNHYWVTPYTYDILVRGMLVPRDDSINVKSAGCPAGLAAPAPRPSAEPLSVTDRAEPVQPVAKAAAPAPVNAIILSGTIAQSGTATFDPAYQMLTTAALDQSDPAGAYCIRFTGSGSTPFCFNLSFTDPETGEAFDPAAFSFQVAFPANTTSIDLLYQGNVTGSLPVSKNAPVVSFTSPMPNSQWSGGVQTIQWTASDADGDKLTYSLLYSSDGGNTYTPMALDLTASPYTLDPSMIMGGSQVYFQVQASDGVNTTAATVGPVNVKQTPTVGPLPVFTVSARAGQSVQGSLLVSNTGTGPLTITSATIDNSAFLVVAPSFPFIIPAGGQSSLTIQFLSSTTGPQNGTLTIASNDPSSPAKTPVSGQVFASTGPATILNFGELDFGSVTVGQPASLPLMVYNAGGSNVVVSSVTFSNPSFTAVGLATPLTVTAGSTGTITVKFAPTAAAALTASMVINSNDPAYPAQTVILTGTGVASVACTYSLSSGGQAFGPSSSTGTITITTQAGCAWSVGQLPSWITLTSPASGTGSGTVTFSIQPNSGADLSASITIGGVSFIIEQQAAAIPGLSLIGSMPHLAAEGGWLTTFTFVNKSTSSAIARTNLLAPGGSALTLPVNLPQQPAISGPVLASSLDQTIAPNASFVMQATGPAAASYLEGSAQLAATGAVDGFAIFHYNPTQQEAVVPMETRTAPSYLLAFDNTNGVLTGVALENVSAAAANIPFVIRDDAGAMVTTGSIPLAGSGHTSFVLSTSYAQTANIRGTVEFDTPSDGQISALGIRYTAGTTTTIPALANVTSAGGSMAHLAVNNGWETTFVLVNTGTSAASATLKFFDDNGNALSLPLTFPQGAPAAQTASTLTQNIAPNASLWVQSVGASPNATQAQTGSVQLTTTGNVGGFVIFRYNTNGQEAVVPLESRNAPSYLIAYDNTAQTATGIAIANASPAPINVPVTLRDDTGALLAPGTGSISLPANGHSSFVLSTLFPQTANIRGTVEFDAPSGAEISVLGIRSPPALTFTTLPPLAKGAAASAVTLSVDGGTFTNAVGLPGAATAMFVNRLTPPSYPATLTAVEIYFGNRSDGLAPNSQITLVGATNPSGSASFSAATLGVLNQYNAGVTAVGVFNTFTLPAPITITSGDFVVGFDVSNPSGLFPADEDQSTKSQGRSYVSSDGINFSVVDSFGANVAGNFGIRALVTVGGP